ncbi:protein of unknown function [Paraburkholderia fungorum]|uniref:DUF305 domain-containing protein n=1 Tax=Paraburkholderia fungorum TaxID=134537 RepID=A0A1H1H5Z7_9BURK|nr:DUF305 domain-containing protein [Paraburkholderia fungorum]SDR20789.1 protein of unknown function [Paraburkholderia fungorum]
MENLKNWRPAWLPLIVLTGLLTTFPLSTLAQHRAAPDPMEKPFLAENNEAMNRMMTGMAAAPSGDIDDDFVAMMQPHHQGAIDMAEVELRYGHNEQLRRIAQEIIVDQQQEIVAMNIALNRAPPPPAPVPTQMQPVLSPQTAPHQTGMQMPMPANARQVLR